MKILGLDVSTKSTGWFITKRSCGVITPDPKLSFGEKLVVFRKELEALLEKYKPDLVVIEDAYFRAGFGNIHTLKALVKFAGVAQELCASLEIQTEIITATTARKHCCGTQDSPFKKKEVFGFFKKKYNLDDWTFSKHNDITDAMALVWGYRGLIKAEKESAKKKSGKKKKRE
jgi:Holliday junction resolvasome RuvABC endonuclease subunit